jgi:hypothetical protein
MTSTAQDRCRRGAIGLVVGAALTAVAAPPAAAGLQLTQYGPRAGFSIDPDQFTLGAFTDWGELAPLLNLVTSADIGFGDHVFTFLVNGDVLYHIPTGPDAPIDFYAGGGLAFVFADVDVPEPVPPGVDSSTTDLGMNLVVGVAKDLGGYKTGSLELRIGLVDTPDVKVTAALGFF